MTIRFIPAALMFFLSGLLIAQPSDLDLDDYFQWFQEQSQVGQLYDLGAYLYVFTEHTPLFEYPDREAALLCNMRAGTRVTTLSINGGEEQMLVDFAGMQDLWYEVVHQEEAGQKVKGFVWGGHLAKGWRLADLDDDGQLELLLLGLAAGRHRKAKPSSEIKLIETDGSIQRSLLPNLCVHEGCAVTPLLRVLEYRQPGDLCIVEASTMQLGCQRGLQRSFLYWDGHGLHGVYREEVMSDDVMLKKDFLHRLPADESGRVRMVRCTFSHEDEAHEPVWKCEEVNIPATEDSQIKSQPKKAKKPARAR